jgi:hypothetical protein
VKKLAFVIGAVESTAIFLYGLSIVIKGTVEHSSVGSPLVQFIIYSIFAASLAACTRGISKQQNWARTPFFSYCNYLLVSPGTHSSAAP